MTRLGDLIEGGGDDVVTGCSIDSRDVVPGHIFGAFAGARHNGEDFIDAAVAAGAVAVVARSDANVTGALHIKDQDPRRRFAEIAGRFFAPYPAVCVAITGTNGKTSTVEMTRQLWRMAGHPAGSIGTLGVATSEDRTVGRLTTPDAATFLQTAAGLQREGVTHLAFEASSHGLHQHRNGGLPVEAGAFTNLGRDHLDYHGDMANYLTAKLRLFSEVVRDGGSAVVWSEDAESARVVDLSRARGLRTVCVGPGGSFLRLIDATPSALGQRLVIEVGGATTTVDLPLIGAYQAANALVAAGLVIVTGGGVAQTLSDLARLQPVRGRLERAAITAAGAPIYVDYAHTPDALAAATAALRPHASGRIILVFGAGGDRDAGKRVEMGAVAARDADLAIVTDDNPRSEDPAAIRSAIRQGAPDAREIGDRRSAIAAALAEAHGGDVVLIAGKGHETGQIVGDRTLPFDDVVVVREEAGA